MNLNALASRFFKFFFYIVAHYAETIYVCESAKKLNNKQETNLGFVERYLKKGIKDNNQ